ncbi:MAG: hypothetical protein IJI36_11235 [Kiritimatiellae bacterium]|nr:hypothetical protein [Kiritimatiellia bacterium]
MIESCRSARAVFLAMLACVRVTAGNPAAVDSLVVAEGRVSRTLDLRNGRLLGASYKLADGTEFMRGGSPEFAFRVDGELFEISRTDLRTGTGG